MRHPELKLDNQICFPLYACSREMTKAYKPLLDESGLTYTQYLTMMALWERDGLTVRELGETLYLDSGTLTPLLKKLEARGLVVRERDLADERRVIVRLTAAGDALQDQVAGVPAQMACRVKLDADEAAELYRLLYKVITGFELAED